MKETELPLPSEGESKVDLFKNREIRKVMHNGEWWFSIVDIVEAITDSNRPRQYWADLKSKLPKEGADQLYAQIVQLKMRSSDGKEYSTDAANIEMAFRILQSIPSPKAEPFKKWLAKVGFERLEEIKDPELAIKRAISIYRAKGYDDNWIEASITNKASRDVLTYEWDIRSMAPYIGILTDAISVQTFGISTKAHKRIKHLSGQNLRDHMTPIELTLTTLGEQATTEIIRIENPKSLSQHQIVAQRGGMVAGVARQQIEQQTRHKVVSSANYLTPRQRQNNAKLISEDIGAMLQRLLASPKRYLLGETEYKS